MDATKRLKKGKSLGEERLPVGSQKFLVRQPLLLDVCNTAFRTEEVPEDRQRGGGSNTSNIQNGRRNVVWVR